MSALGHLGERFAVRIAVGQGLERNWRDPVRRRDNRRGFHSAAEGTAVAVLDRTDGQEIARGLGLANAQGGQRRIVATPLQNGRPNEICLRRSVTNEVKNGFHLLPPCPLTPSAPPPGPLPASSWDPPFLGRQYRKP